MPLQSVNLAPRDDGFAVSFVMLDGVRAIRCYAQQGTLDAIEQSRTDDARERLERFDRHRAAFESVASDLFDAGLPLRITADHNDMAATMLRPPPASSGLTVKPERPS